jgi:hypothetical protein
MGTPAETKPSKRRAPAAPVSTTTIEVPATPLTNTTAEPPALSAVAGGDVEAA